MSNLSVEDFTPEDLVDFQRAFQLQTKIESSPSFRDGDAEKLLKKVNLTVEDDKKKRFLKKSDDKKAPIALRTSLSPDAAGASGGSERVDFMELLETMSRNFVDDNTTEKELEEAFKVLKSDSKSDELCFSDFEKAYRRLGDEFSQAIAIEEVQEIFEHFQVKRKNSVKAEGESKSSEISKTESVMKDGDAGGKELKSGKSVVGKIKIREFIKTVSQDSN